MFPATTFFYVYYTSVGLPSQVGHLSFAEICYNNDYYLQKM
ncbi:hypothetical protein SSUR61_1642 [Streptococcus suis R61]|uniref:Uncharacterized protein n=1 Tax=Streptococcus suis R61 TaxID=996306 RepID=A0AA87F740_STRSU|nr:hypothetical protein SSUR61_1642 [Streptococcus suis R61]